MIRTWCKDHPIQFMACYLVFYLAFFKLLEQGIQVPDLVLHCRLDDLIPFRVENALWGTEKFPPMYGYIGFIPQDAFYLKLICEEKNPLRVYTEINDPIYRDSVMEAYLMFEPVSSRANEENYLNFAVNANGVLHAEYGSRRMYRSYFTEAERVGFECHAEVHENDWTAELKVPVKILEKIYGPLNLGEGSYFTCNFYKISESKEAEHYASYSPISVSYTHLTLPTNSRV